MSVAKSPEFSILYNKKKLDADLSKKIQSVAFHFYLHGQANDIDIEIEDGDLEFAKDLKPKEGDTIKLNIGYSGENLFDCGEFEIDEVSYDLSGKTVTLRGTSTEIKKSFYETQYREHSGSLEKIVKGIATRNGLNFDGKIAALNIDRKSQSNSDLEFLNELADMFGYMLKIERNTLYFKPWELLRSAKEEYEIEADQLLAGSYLNDSGRTYQYCEATYSRKGATYKKKVEDTYNKNGLILKIDARSESAAQTEAEAKAALTMANLEAVSGTFVFEGKQDLEAGSIIKLKGAGHLDGLYCIKSGSHEISDNGSAFLTTVEVFEV